MKKSLSLIAFALITFFTYGQELTINGIVLQDGEGLGQETVYLIVPATATSPNDTLAEVFTEENGGFYLEVQDPFENNGFVGFTSENCGNFDDALFPVNGGDT